MPVSFHKSRVAEINLFHFRPAGAEAFRRDNPAAKVVFFDTGHFALETHAAEIGQEVRSFLSGVYRRG